MTLQIVGTATAKDDGSGASSYTLTPPVMQEDDVLYVWYGWVFPGNQAVGLASGNSSGVFNDLTGDLYQNDARDSNARGAYFRQGSTPDTSLTIPASGGTGVGNAAVCMAVRNVDSVSPFDVSTQIASGDNTGASNPPSITPVTSEAWVLALGFGTDDSSPNSFSGFNTYSNNVHNTAAGTTYGCHIAMARTVWGGSGAVDPPIWTGGGTAGSDSWIGVTIAVRPGASTLSVVRYPRSRLIVQN